MDSDELCLWAAYKALYGLPHDRLVAGQAISGAAVCQSHGSKVQPKDLVPTFQPVKPPAKVTAELFRAWAEAHNARQNGAAGD